MKALKFDQVGTLEALKLVEIARPMLQDGDALVEVRAAGLNPSDVKNVLGRFSAYTTLPRIPGRDFSGVVVAGPEEWTGREVWGTGRDLGFFRDGSHAQFLTLPVGGLSAKPKSLSFAEAASIGVPFTTAINALDRTGVIEKTNLLVTGANGAVGRAAITLARLRGAQVVAAVRSTDQMKVLEAEGFSAIQLSDNQPIADVLKRHFANGAEVIFDTTGFLLPQAVNALATFGRIAVIAAPVDGLVQTPILNLYRRGGSIVGVNTLLYDVSACAEMLTRTAPYFDCGALRAPAGLQICALEDGLRAYAETNRGCGVKFVLSMTQ